MPDILLIIQEKNSKDVPDISFSKFNFQQEIYAYTCLKHE